jgi:hypothetical protein
VRGEVFRPKREVWGRRRIPIRQIMVHNEELCHLFAFVYMRSVKSRIIRWAGRVARMVSFRIMDHRMRWNILCK